MEDVDLEDYFTPSEILNMMPELKEMGFKKEDFGILARLNIVNGIRNNHKKTVMVRPKDVLKMIRYINARIDEKKFPLDKYGLDRDDRP